MCAGSALLPACHQVGSKVSPSTCAARHAARGQACAVSTRQLATCQMSMLLGPGCRHRTCCQPTGYRATGVCARAPMRPTVHACRDVMRHPMRGMHARTPSVTPCLVPGSQAMRHSWCPGRRPCDTPGARVAGHATLLVPGSQAMRHSWCPGRRPCDTPGARVAGPRHQPLAAFPPPSLSQLLCVPEKCNHPHP
eukprot:359289-Chlamydomonas_euryale.AAC.4